MYVNIKFVMLCTLTYHCYGGLFKVFLLEGLCFSNHGDCRWLLMNELHLYSHRHHYSDYVHLHIAHIPSPLLHFSHPELVHVQTHRFH